MSIRIAASRYCSSIAQAARPHDGIAIKYFQRQGGAPSISLRFRGKSTVSATPGAAKEAAAEATSASSEGVPIGKTLVAMSLAIATISAGAVLAEKGTASMVPTFDPKQQRFDQSTFIGRLSKMLLACDPSLNLCSGEEVKRCKAMVDDYENQLKNLPEGVSETEMSRKLWEAQRVVTAAIHPDSGETIPRPFRMSGYALFNGPICVAMVASQSTAALLVWSWINQSHNALINYYNRNASSEMTNETFAKSYAAAVGSALAVAFGLATFIQKRYSPAQAKNLLRWVAFPSAVVASSLNCYIVRSPEIDTGIPLVNSDGDEVLPNEMSKIAAERGVNSTTFSRALLQAPVYFLPPVLMGVLPPLKNAIMKNPIMRVPMTTYLVLVCFGIGLPSSVAIFPQMGEIKVEEAEEKYHKLQDEKNGGKPYEVLFYNKGL
mmetsp:Transcript_36899/g.66355  ORF Transcript_36899/g.66355 Transcript_36899/m.66355 type:complete len:434 (+) Transcript_36899:64-1365(+)|eukprot:CAMPEP_0201890224 /NCGR_PEP_ID=MMETSP0902-20130614/31780_1 /ASSEMBLY_ACC=CAM_ASM_000551 /TAXON_ID=420261 /ORGANISM="Thalassiosira antarctica, Strain CCMP982" /LENGTH=433 /DNA_ID=CAMNT_0048421027 /DNA_START=32 /DNA_END=1333 /DNA_ORIENTATION=-